MAFRRRGNFDVLWWLTLLVVLAQIAFGCDRTPDGSGANKSPADGRFLIRIAGNPEKYLPGDTYKIILAGRGSMRIPDKFIGFMLAVEKENPDPRDHAQHDVGTFSLLGDALTTISHKCNNTVTQTSTLPKTEIQVLWSAPPPGSGCVVFRATVIEHRDVWYMDDGPLSKVLCEDEQEPSDVQPTIVEPCCACDEAKYEVTFEGMWSRNTHPKDFPENNWLTRFSDIIGASHTVDYRFWEYGHLASEGLRQVAEHGSTRTLESELKAQSDQIRTIIKARGISFPNVTGKTFAVFRVDSKHHLVSLVSMIDPSPDWIVGVSGLELCLPNCSWIEHKVQNLYPWDAGTDSGPTYISPDQPTHPRDVIRRIKTNYPNDPRSPFYDETGTEMKPLARIYFSRQRLYEKSCETTSNEEPDEESACETGSWNDWTDCSVKCGKGKRYRQRQYKDSVLAHRMGCKKKLTQREVCYGNGPACNSPQSSNEDESFSRYEDGAECALTEWSPWSSCSSSCGKGTRTQKRRYKNRKARKKCEAGAGIRPILERNEECYDMSNCAGDIGGENTVDEHPDCRMTEWSDWSACSVSCGNGTRIRTRLRMPKPFISNNYDQSRDEGNYVEAEDPCENVRTEEEVTCYEPSCDSPIAPDYCYYDPEVGHCRTTTNRWYYDYKVKDCAVFTFSCGDNKNNFMSREDCLKTCRVEDPFSNIPVSSLRREMPQKKVDCKLSQWTRGPCNATCGDGYRVKTRKILRSARSGGTPCPKKLVHFERCTTYCHNSEQQQQTLSHSHRSHNRPRYNSTIHNVYKSDDDYAHLCEYSEWSPWSPCTATCGDKIVVRQRTRTLLNPELSHKCMDRLQVQACDIMPCLLNN